MLLLRQLFRCWRCCMARSWSHGDPAPANPCCAGPRWRARPAGLRSDDWPSQTTVCCHGRDPGYAPAESWAAGRTGSAWMDLVQPGVVAPGLAQWRGARRLLESSQPSPALPSGMPLRSPVSGAIANRLNQAADPARLQLGRAMPWRRSTACRCPRAPGAGCPGADRNPWVSGCHRRQRPAAQQDPTAPNQPAAGRANSGRPAGAAGAGANRASRNRRSCRRTARPVVPWRSPPWGERLGLVASGRLQCPQRHQAEVYRAAAPPACHRQSGPTPAAAQSPEGAQVNRVWFLKAGGFQPAASSERGGLPCDGLRCAPAPGVDAAG